MFLATVKQLSLTWSFLVAIQLLRKQGSVWSTYVSRKYTVLISLENVFISVV